MELFFLWLLIGFLIGLIDVAGVKGLIGPILLIICVWYLTVTL